VISRIGAIFSIGLYSKKLAGLDIKVSVAIGAIDNDKLMAIATYKAAMFFKRRG